RIAWLALHSSRLIADVPQEPTAATRGRRVELERHTVGIVEVHTVDRLALAKHCLRRRFHLRQATQDSIDVEVLNTPAEMGESWPRLPVASRAPLRDRNVRRPVSDPKDRLASLIVLKGVHRHAEDAAKPLNSRPQIGTAEADVVERAHSNGQPRYGLF